MLLVFAFGGPAVAENTWSSGFGQGYMRYGTSEGSNHITIGCDVGASLDHSRTRISLEIGGLLPPDSYVDFHIDGQTIRMPTDKSGSAPTGDCVECIEKFQELWSLLRSGTRLEITASDGRSAQFSLNGTARLMSEPCPTKDVGASRAATTLVTEPAAAAAAWSSNGTKGDRRAGASGTAGDGVTVLDIGCNQLLGPRLGGAIQGYPGDALTRVDDARDVVVFEFTDAAGKITSFRGEVNYYSPDKSWALRDYPVSMLEPFAKSSRLTLRNDGGTEIASFSLRGSAKAREHMRRVCGL